MSMGSWRNNDYALDEVSSSISRDYLMRCGTKESFGKIGCNALEFDRPS